ncbi:MAG TPA: MaoC family dehydratase [Methylomirabilota bacterium]|jgi:acyl dehydratase
MIGKTIGQLTEGDTAVLVRVVAEDDIAGFIEAVGDYNPVHSDRAYAATTPFRDPIAPGIFTAGLISAVIGTELPGPGSIYLSQSLKFIKPVKAGDTITARVEISEVLRERNRVRLLTVCTNQRGEEVLSGEAWVMPSKTAVVYDESIRADRRAAALGTLALQPWAWAAQSMALWGSLGLSLMAGACGSRATPVTSGGRR